MVEMFLFKLPETARRGMDISDEVKQYEENDLTRIRDTMAYQRANPDMQ